MANKHEINGYIYVTSDETIKLNDFYIIKGFQKPQKINSETEILVVKDVAKKIILCNNPNLPIQQLTTEEVEYLKGVDSFEVNWTMKAYSVDKEYKIIIPQETEQPKDEIDRFFVDMVCNPKQTPQETEKILITTNKKYSDYIKELDKLNQPKESIEEENPIDFLMTNLYKKGYLKEVDGNEPINLMNVAKEKLKQTMYSEDEVNILLETFKFYLGCGDEIDHKQWFNKHKKQ